MAKGILIVQSRPSDPAREDEYNDWYSNTHIPQVCQVPGFVAARRYKVQGGSDDPSYVAIYELDTDDLDAAISELVAWSTDGRIEMSDVLQLDPPPSLTLCKLL